MSRNGSGTYTLPAGNPVVTGTTITSSWANTTMQNIADGLTQSVASDGQTPMSGALNMTANKITNLGTPTVSTDATTKAYVDLTQTASGITGGSINGTTIGNTTPSTGAFTNLSATGTVSFTSTGAAAMPSGTTAQQPVSSTNGMIRYNTTTNVIEGYVNGAWTSLGGNTGPTFSAYQSSAQTISSTTYTKVTFTTKEFDTNTNYDTTTSRFTPTVAGYYQVTTGVGMGAGASSIYLMIYKNGAIAKYGQYPASAYAANMSALIQMNGSTDYLEVYLFLGTGQSLGNTAANTYFQASLARGA